VKHFTSLEISSVKFQCLKRELINILIREGFTPEQGAGFLLTMARVIAKDYGFETDNGFEEPRSNSSWPHGIYPVGEF
jgi:hypothetical protein